MDVTADLTLTESDLNHKGNVLVEADEIKSNASVYQAVTKHMKNKAAKYTRIADLRAKLANADLDAAEPESLHNRKENVSLDPDHPE